MVKSITNTHLGGGKQRGKTRSKYDHFRPFSVALSANWALVGENTSLANWPVTDVKRGRSETDHHYRRTPHDHPTAHPNFVILAQPCAGQQPRGG